MLIRYTYLKRLHSIEAYLVYWLIFLNNHSSCDCLNKHSHPTNNILNNQFDGYWLLFAKIFKGSTVSLFTWNAFIKRNRPNQIQQKNRGCSQLLSQVSQCRKKGPGEVDPIIQTLTLVWVLVPGCLLPFHICILCIISKSITGSAIMNT